MRILIVEDDRDTASSTELLLQVAGHQTCVATDGERALQLACPYDLVLLDLGLPGVDGYEVAARLKRIKPPPIVVVTGFGDEQTRVRSFAAGADLHLIKPVVPQELLRLVEQLPGGRR